MATFVRPPLDFEQHRELWAKYELADDTIVKVKVVLTRVTKVEGNQQGSQPTGASPYSLDFQFIVVVLTNERGHADATVHSKEEIKAAIVRDDIRFRTIEQDWNEYVADDNMRLKIQPILLRVGKTSLFNGKGEPIYDIDLNATVQITPPTTALPSPS